MVKINLVTSKIENIKTDALVFFVLEKEKISKEISHIDNKLNGAISKLYKKGYFNGEEKEIHLLDTYEKIKADKIILAGLGKKEKFSRELLRRAVFNSLNYAKNHS